MKGRGRYILNAQGEPEYCEGLFKWANWYETADRQVADTLLADTHISTIFLGGDMDHTNDGPPRLWETMVCGGPLADEQKRCSGSREQAQAMHNEMVERVQAVLALNYE